MADAQQNSVGNHLAELYADINKYQQQRDEADRNLNNAKKTFAKYLKDSGIDKLLNTDTPTDLFGNTTGAKPKRQRVVKSEEEKAQQANQTELNKKIYVSEYPLGLGKDNVPKYYPGRSAKNLEIQAMMKDDERNYADSQAQPQTPAAPKAPAKKK